MKVTDASQIRALDLNRQADLDRAQRPDNTATEDRVTTSESAGVARAVAAATRQLGTAAQAATLAAIEAAVRQGTYVPDPARIAARILDQAEVAAQLQALLRR